jgi:hypothetical protein
VAAWSGGASHRWLRSSLRDRVYDLSVEGKGYGEPREPSRRPPTFLYYTVRRGHQPYRVGRPRLGRESMPKKTVGPPRSSDQPNTSHSDEAALASSMIVCLL